MVTNELDACIGEYRHESFRPREAEALLALRKIASMVKPIMRQRGWRVGVLMEIYPQESNLLGLNHNMGQKICLRLRYPGDERQFLPMEQVVDTMLHELSHNVHGPHNEAFHNLWNQLRDEHENLVRKGYTGEGFLSTGNRLGGGRIPMHEARRRARAATEQRRVQSAGSGQKLGGMPVRRGQDMRKVIADAATRRLTVTRGCASEGTSKQREREIIEHTSKNTKSTKPEADDPDEEAIMIAYIDLIQEEEREKYGPSYRPPSKENPLGSQGTPIPLHEEQSSSARAPSIPTSTKPTPSPYQPPPQHHPSSSTPSTSKRKEKDDYNAPWTCDICTLVNPSNYLCCDACTTERPSPPPSPGPSSTGRSAPAPAPPANSNNNNINNNFPPTPRTNSHTASIHDSNAKKAVRSLINLERTGANQQQEKSMGWLCHGCGNWMEAEWWTCAACGRMKLSS